MSCSFRALDGLSKTFRLKKKRTGPEALESLGQSDSPFRLQGQIRKVKALNYIIF